MNGGIILLDKPSGMTSMACDNFIKRTMGTGKVGHSGTLDPFATGLLPIFWGDALKVVRYTDDYDKAYSCTAFFGSETDTEDTEGEIVGGRMPSPEELNELEATDFKAVRDAFSKVSSMTMQEPPLYSAKKINGQKAYDLARAGKKVDLPPHPVRIDSLEIKGIRIEGGAVLVDFTVSCSKGTYIRSICRDAGRITGFGAHAIALRRIKAGPFSIDDAFTPEQISALAEVSGEEEFSVSRETALTHLKKFELEASEHKDIILGKKIAVPADTDLTEGVLYRAMYLGKTAAVVYKSEEEGKAVLRIDRMLWKDD
ncbi:MAG: tRNA pseudouridine(55) synthase TruB [Clostridiales bacterium]|nr:tRNA pseudouridine(55) synthase TruB [Clostridiales bacterium]